jgi:hypothetical protein
LIAVKGIVHQAVFINTFIGGIFFFLWVISEYVLGHGMLEDKFHLMT